MDEALQRRLEYGKIGEDAFENFCKSNKMFYRQFGLTKMEGYYVPKEVFYKIPKLMQCSPDFWVVKNEFHFVECKMADKQTASHIKIKHHDLKYYKQWSSVDDFLFYFHNPTYHESYLVEMCYIEQLFESGELEEGCYPDNNKTFYKIPMEDVRRFGKQV